MCRLIATAMALGLTSLGTPFPFPSREERAPLVAGSRGILGVGFTTDGKSAFTTDGLSIKLWDWKESKEIAAMDTRSFSIGKAECSADNKYIIGLGDESIRSWNLESRKRGEILLFRSNGFGCFSISNNGRLLAAVPRQANYIVLVDLETKKRTELTKEHSQWIRSIAFSPDGNFLASAGGLDEQTLIWDVEKRKPIHTLRGRNDFPNHVAWTHDSKILVVATTADIVFWNASNGDFISRLGTARNYVTGLAVSPKQHVVALTRAGSPAVVTFYRMDTKEFTEKHGHTAQINCLAFSPDGKLLVTGSEDRTARVWEVPSK